MRFLYHELAGVNSIEITDERYRHIFRARRQKVGDMLYVRNLKDDMLYSYEVKEVKKRDALLLLKEQERKEAKPKRYLHLGWCVVDTKTIEKSLPFLNELGVGKISFIYCDRSQMSFKPNLDKLKKIAINSCEQCGRSTLIEFETVKELKQFFVNYPKSAVLDFGGKNLSCKDEIESIVIGCEGGFSKSEREMFKDIYKVDSDMVLRSETAAIFVSSVILGA